ncbi:MAG: hypothetical protein GC180_00700 [Bacteroidetes bacterium]|nr:hypothetical protein [Bacteroidota bacterium]
MSLRYQYFIILAQIVLITACSGEKGKCDASLKEHVQSVVDRNTKVKVDSIKQAIVSEYETIHHPSPLDHYYLYSCMSWYMRERGVLDSALIYADSMLWSLITESDVNEEYVQAFRNKGMLLRHMKYYDHALRDLSAAMIFADNSHDGCVKGQLYHSMGTIYYAKGDYEPAIKYYKKCVQELQSCDSTVYFPFVYLINSSYNAMGLCYERMKQWDSSDYFYRLSISFVERHLPRFEGDDVRKWGETAIAVAQGNLGWVLAKLGRPEEGKAELKESIKKNSGKQRLKEDTYLSRIKLTRICAELGEMKQASQLLHFLDSTSGNLSSNTAVIRLQELKYNMALAKGDSIGALKEFQRYVSIRDSVDHAGLYHLPFSLSESYEYIAQKQELMMLQEQEEDTHLLLLVLSMLVVLLGLILFLIRKNLKGSKAHIASLDKLNREIFKQHDDLDNAMKSLESSNEENKRLMKVLAHDLRSPVSAMISLAQLINQEGNLNKEQAENVRMIEKLGYDSVKFMEDILHARDKKVKQIKNQVDLLELLEYCATFMRFRAEEKSQNITVRGESIPMELNRDQIWRVINNLLNNSIKFSPPASLISVGLKREGDYALICIEDEGIGIPVEIRDKVFQMFSNTGRSGTEGEKTFGLGLPISKQIVEAHEGTIWFESKEGKGTCFFIKLPI